MKENKNNTPFKAEDVNWEELAAIGILKDELEMAGELGTAMKNGDRQKLREITHRMQPMWELLQMEETLSAYRALLKDETINDKILNEHTRQIMDYAAILIKVAEAEIKRVTDETEDTDS